MTFPRVDSRVSRRAILGSTVAAAVSACRIGHHVSASDDSQAAEIPQVTRYPVYSAAGTHRELGQQHGDQAKEHIRAHIDFMCSSMKLRREELRRRALTFRPLFDRYCPHLVDEIAGLGEGAGITFADALAANIRSALTQSPEGGCTAFVVSPRGTSDSGVLIGQNSDMLPATIEFAYVLRLKPKDKPAALMWSFGGMIGYHGINSRGVGHFANDLGGGPKPRFGMPHYPLKRLMLECGTLQEVERLVRRIPLWTNGNYVLCDGAGRILDIEATTKGPVRISDSGRGFIAHSNHFVCKEHATEENFEQSAADSFTRLDRMNELITSRFGRLSVDDFKTFLRDRQGHPDGICRFAQTNDTTAPWTRTCMTVASLIAEPQRRRLHVAVGNQKETPFVAYDLDED